MTVAQREIEFSITRLIKTGNFHEKIFERPLWSSFLFLNFLSLMKYSSDWRIRKSAGLKSDKYRVSGRTKLLKDLIFSLVCWTTLVDNEGDYVSDDNIWINSTYLFLCSFWPNLVTFWTPYYMDSTGIFMNVRVIRETWVQSQVTLYERL